MTTIGITLEPLDVLFFRDGRSFGAASRVVSGLPTPQVLAGAVRTALLERAGVSFLSLRGKTFDRTILPPRHQWIADIRFRGPWLCEPQGDVVADVFVPMPATVYQEKPRTIHHKRIADEAIHLLRPLGEDIEVPGWSHKCRPLWMKTVRPTEAVLGFLDLQGLKKVLKGDLPEFEQCKPIRELYDFDHRTGNEINGGSLTVEEGQLYGISFLAMQRGFGFYAEIDVPDDRMDALSGIEFLAFGGEGKRVRVRVLDQPVSWPKPSSTSTRKMILLTTPLRNVSNGIPSNLPGRLVAAAVPSPIAISGWDLAKGGPKPTQFAAPAGSVYFLDTTEAIPNLTDELGYGCYLEGEWNYAH